MRRAGRRGVGFRQIPAEYLYETLGLYSVAHSGDHERSIRSIMNTESGDHEHALAII